MYSTIHFIDIEKADKAGQRHGADGRYTSGEGGHTDESLRAMAKDRGYVVPPAWTGVQLSKDPKADLQVKGIDKKGRAVYIYSREFAEKQAAAKFARLKRFMAAVPKLMTKINNDFNQRPEAQVLYLISKTGFRIGSDRDTKAEKQAYGATTLRSEHVKVDGDKMSFDFIGKKGVRIPHELTDAKLANTIKDRQGRLFNTTDTDVRSYLKDIGGNGFKVKDFRTYVGTSTAMRVAHTMGRPTDEKSFKKFQNAVCKSVAATLGNTPAIAKKSYIDPSIWSVYYNKGGIK